MKEIQGAVECGSAYMSLQSADLIFSLDMWLLQNLQVSLRLQKVSWVLLRLWKAF